MSRDCGNRLLIDTNVALDLLSPGRPQFEEANRVAELCNGGGDIGFITAGAIKDAYYVLCKCCGKETAREAVATLMDLFAIAPLAAEECDLSLRCGEPDFVDGLVRACAELNDIDFILTRDAAAFKGSKVRAMDCADYLKFVRGIAS